MKTLGFLNGTREHGEILEGNKAREQRREQSEHFEGNTGTQIPPGRPSKLYVPYLLSMFSECSCHGSISKSANRDFSFERHFKNN